MELPMQYPEAAEKTAQSRVKPAGGQAACSLETTELPKVMYSFPLGNRKAGEESQDETPADRKETVHGQARSCSLEQ